MGGVDLPGFARRRACLTHLAGGTFAAEPVKSWLRALTRDDLLPLGWDRQQIYTQQNPGFLPPVEPFACEYTIESSNTGDIDFKEERPPWEDVGNAGTSVEMQELTNMSADHDVGKTNETGALDGLEDVMLKTKRVIRWFSTFSEFRGTAHMAVPKVTFMAQHGDVAQHVDAIDQSRAATGVQGQAKREETEIKNVCMPASRGAATDFPAGPPRRCAADDFGTCSRRMQRPSFARWHLHLAAAALQTLVPAWKAP